MISTGNDIVALSQIDKQKTNQVRFYSHILSSSEQALYHQLRLPGLCFEYYVWLLWSVKESAYKYLKRLQPELLFSPTKIIIQRIELPQYPQVNDEEMHWEGNGLSGEFYIGTVSHQTQHLHFRAKISTQFIAAVVSDSEFFENVYWGVKVIAGNDNALQSKEARLLLLSRLSRFFGDLHIEKSSIGYPVILKDGNDLHIPASLAHSDCFVSYSFVLTPSE